METNFELLRETVSAIVTVKEEEFQMVVQQLKVIELKKNEIWEKDGKVSQNMGFVNRGVLRQYYLNKDTEYTTDFFQEGEFVGNHISYHTKKPSPTVTQAIEACELFVMPFANFERLHELLPSAKQTSKVVGEEKLSKLNDRNISLLTDTPEERYYKLVESKPNLINRVPQYLIAQYLGIRPESLSRIRKRHNS